ncbi:hypothetical protein D1B17_10390 [Companilactobacillus zhachilii]|uniref:BIG2 domain-containing protein n=1 Tax=Companilactobacillus zhachilii TaxID=2304606 RepID=A0A386PSM5_9LACO|nr:Ig-like domain-containing protein [Companilactobacillus zhachilii]AYE39016.1 hypothetical protein D1B17_10390 [Companilactobacillus zhachilii]
MKKIIIIVLINILALLVGLFVVNKKFWQDEVQTTVVAGIIPGISFPDISNPLPSIPLPSLPTNPEDLMNIALDNIIDKKHKPTSDPFIFLIFWLTLGYNLQPSDKYTVVNSSKTLYTSSGNSIWESLLNPLATPHYLWYQSTDKENWKRMYSETDKYLTVTPNKVGTVYYKQATIWYWQVPANFTDIVYSKVASVTTLPKYRDADKLTVTADGDYLYNNQENDSTIFVKGLPSPSDATGNITWSVDDSSLATVDKKTGQVIANKNGKSGIVRITGELSNTAKSSVKGSIDIKVGGGLDDMTVHEGDTAKFDIRGHFDQKPTSVVWHKILPNGQDKVVSDDDTMSYTTPKTSYNDNLDKYFAVMTITNGTKNKQIKTNLANLSVLKNDRPDVSIKGTIFNDKGSHNDTGEILWNVSSGDILTFKLNMSYSNPNGALTNGLIGLRVPKTMQPEAITLDNKNISGLDFSQVPNPDNSEEKIFVINNIDLANSAGEHSLEIKGRVGEMGKILSYKSMFMFQCNNAYTGSPFEVDSNPLVWYLGHDMITLKAYEWKYQNIDETTKGKLVKRQKNDSEVLHVDDNRINKASTTLSLYQYNPFNLNNDITLSAETRYYKKDGSFVPIGGKNGVVVEETTEGVPLKSIFWSLDEGPLLYVLPRELTLGSYTTLFTWQLSQSIPNTNLSVTKNS